MRPHRWKIIQRPWLQEMTMLGIGVAMVASLGEYHRLVSIHRPLGIAILIVVAIRFVNRQFSTLPPFPASMSSQERFVAHASEVLLYTLLFVLPLIGWGMLSAELPHCWLTGN